MEPLSILMLAVWGGWGALFVARRYKEEKAHAIEKLEEFAAPFFPEILLEKEYANAAKEEAKILEALFEEADVHPDFPGFPVLETGEMYTLEAGKKVYRDWCRENLSPLARITYIHTAKYLAKEKKDSDHRAWKWERERIAALTPPVVAKLRPNGAAKRLAKLKANTKKLEPAKLNRLRDLCREATELTGVAHEIDHMDSVHNGGGNDIDNLRIISATENRRKGRRSI